MQPGILKMGRIKSENVHELTMNECHVYGEEQELYPCGIHEVLFRGGEDPPEENMIITCSEKANENREAEHEEEREKEHEEEETETEDEENKEEEKEDREEWEKEEDVEVENPEEKEEEEREEDEEEDRD